MTLGHAIIGCGRIAPNHCAGIQHSGLAELRWACDRNPVHARALAENFGIPRVTERLADVLTDPEVYSVSVTVDHRQHAQVARAALLAGKHVLVEKPFTIHVQEAEELVALAKEKGLTLACVSQHRYDPLVRRVRDTLEQGGIGKLLLVNARLLCGRETSYYSESYWHGLQSEEGGSALINQGYHILDLMVLLGGVPEKLNAYASRVFHENTIENEDTLSASFAFSNGALGILSITSGNVAEEWLPQIELIGTHGRIAFDMVFPHHQPIWKTVDAPLGEISTVKKSTDAPGIVYYGDLHENQIKDFLTAAQQGGSLWVRPEQAIQTLRVIQQIYRSTRENGFVHSKVVRATD